MNVNRRENVGGPPPQLDIVSAFRSTLPSLPGLSNKKTQKISKAVMSKFPGIATSVVLSTIIPVILPIAFKQVEDLEKNTLTAVAAILALSFGPGLYYLYISDFASRLLFDETKMDNLTNRTKLRVFRNWEIGNILGYVSTIVFWMSQPFDPYNYGWSLGSFIAAYTCFENLKSLPSEEVVKNNKEDKVIALMRQNIEGAIKKGLLEKDNVMEFFSLNATQNMILYNSLTQISTNKFTKLYSKFFTDPPMMIEGNYITKDFIDDLKNRINQLSSKDREFLLHKLALLEKEGEKAENEKEVTDIFRIISTIGMKIWYIYQFEVKSSIQSFDLTIYDKFINFLAEK